MGISSINTLKSNLIKKPLLDPTRYSILVNGPVGFYSLDYTIYCSNVSLPGRSFATTEQYHHGPIRKVPYSEIFDEVTTTHWATEGHNDREYFKEWQDLIGGGKTYGMAYYNDIVGSVKITVYDRNDAAKKTYELFEAYPLTVSELTLSYDAGDTIPTYTVSWSYHHWETS